MRPVKLGLLTWFLLGALLSCSRSDGTKTHGAASASPTGSVVLNALSKPSSSSAHHYVPEAMPTRVPIRTGPGLAILAGKGVGPIRIGATVKTIERHMNLPCDVRTEKLCRYIGRAVDFHLEDGVVDSIVVHRQGRPAGKDKKGESRQFGIFNGALLPDFEMMMKQSVIRNHLGPPLRTEKVDSDNPNHTVERDYYAGMVVEYDRYDNGQVVLGGVRIEKPEGSKSAAKAAPAASQLEK